MVRPSSRGGVPVFSRPSAKPQRSRVAERPIAGASPTRPAGVCFSPIWMRPRRNVPVVRTTAPVARIRPSARRTAETRPSERDRSSASPSITRQIRRFEDRALHGGGVELAIGLGAGAAHRRALAAVQDAKLDAALVGDAAHQAVEGVDLADQMALAEPADRRIAGHRADGRESVRHQRGFGAHPGRRSRGFAAGVAAADDDNVEFSVHSEPRNRLLAAENAMFHVKNASTFHVKHTRTGHPRTPHNTLSRGYSSLARRCRVFLPRPAFICRCRTPGRSRPANPRHRPGRSAGPARGRRGGAPRR